MDWRDAVGRGAGLATLAPLAKAAKANGTRVTAVFSARRPDLLVSVDLFHSHGADVVAVTDSESTSGPANVERILRRLIAEELQDQRASEGPNPCFLSGPPVPVAAAAAEVLALLAQGRTNRQVGAELYISEKTASVHVSNILAKLGMRDRTELTRYAIEQGLDAD